MNPFLSRALPALMILAAAAAVAPAAEPEGCGVCHGAERVLHGNSVHSGADIGCVSCHGGDPAAVESKERAHAADKGFLGRIPREGVPGACGLCHADVVRMRPYGLRADVLDAYRSSHHGQAVLEKGRTDAATCTDCHGSHDVRRIRDPGSPAHRVQVPATCGKCHGDAALMGRHDLDTRAVEEFSRSVHGMRLARGEPGVPSCADCHDAHAAAPPGANEVAAVCGTCHREARALFRESPHFAASQRGEMGQCVTCHGNHSVATPGYALFDAAPGDPDLTHGRGTRCLTCHEEGSDDRGTAVAKAIGRALRDADAALDAAHARVGEVASSGFFVDDELEALERARRELVRTVPLTHTADLGRVQTSVRRALSFIEEAELGCEGRLREARDRRIYGSFVALALFGVAGFLALRRRKSGGGD